MMGQWIACGSSVLLTASMLHAAEVLPPPVKLSDQDLDAIRRGFDARRDALFEALRGKPFKPAEKAEPLAPGRPPYVRAYTFSVVDFAMRAMWLGEQNAEANAAVLDLARYFIANPSVRDDYDNFYWCMDVVTRLVAFFGRQGSRAPGRLNAETEDALLEMMWLWARSHSRIAEAEFLQSRTWALTSSENHHLQSFSTCWFFARLLKADKRYRDRPYEDGKTAAEHYAAWTAYAKVYFAERARKSLFVEVANGNYGMASLKGIYNIHEFADDPVLKRRAGSFLDLWWATWAEEQFDGVRGGGKTRIYQGGGSLGGWDATAHVAWYYLNIGQGRVPPSNADFTVLTSAYRLPLVVMDIALDVDGRGDYETRRYPLGRITAGEPPQAVPYHIASGVDGIARYSYCTPQFIIGTLMFEARPREDWVAISSQNRWQGVIFRGHPNARIVPQCRGVSRNRVYNAHWSVQSKGTLISQKLKNVKGGAEWRVWVSNAGLTNRVERDEWVFVEARGAYAAVRPVEQGYDWQPEEKIRFGEWLTCRDEYTPVILEVADKRRFADYPAFQNAVLANPLSFERQVLRYRSLYGDALTFYADYSHLPEINGTPVSYRPGMAFDSPFVQSEWDSGVVTIRKGDRKVVLDFNSEQP